MKVILTEKPSVARDIAAHLGANQRHDGYFEGNGYQVTWAFGHLITLKEPEDYDPALKKWSLSTLPFIPEQFELKVAADKGIRKQFAVIKKLFKSADELICATDAGREGELIFRYILSMTGCTRLQWKRLWLSSLTEEALQTAFKNLKPGRNFDNLYAAAKCRSESDWIVGLNATRSFTVRYGQGKMLWSVGRVQTPVLAMIVRRDDDIRHFKSEIFWELFTTYKGCSFKFKGDRFKLKPQAEQVLNQVKNHLFIIQNIDKKKENELPPLLFDLTELQREMNRRLGISAADTLQIAQTLYEQKLITYPRTDSRYLTSDMKGMISQTLEQLRQTRSKEIEPLDLTNLPFSNRIINDKKVTDHHAIIPTGKPSRDLPPQSHAVYHAIVTRLIAAFYPNCIKELTTVDGQSNQHSFQAKGVHIVSPGWTALYPKKTEAEANQSEQHKKDEKSVPEVQKIPSFQMAEQGPHDPFITQGKTKPPAHYSENTLLGAMETAGKHVDDEVLKEALKEKGIGTPATRASIIEVLLKRQYIQRINKILTATDLGRYLIAIIQDPSLKSPELTGEWESKLKAMEQGKCQATDFMQGIGQFTHQLIGNNDITKINYDEFGNCPKCKHPIIKGNRGYGCSKWRDGCTFVLWKEYKGLELNEGQIRSLLQKHILIQPIQNHILSLSDTGILLEIPVPTPPPSSYKPRRKR